MSLDYGQDSVPVQFSAVPDRPVFGTWEWWLQQPELAITILMLWRDRAPASFGAYLAEAMTGTKLSGREAKK